jgi:hypothetical protein
MGRPSRWSAEFGRPSTGGSCSVALARYQSPISLKDQRDGLFGVGPLTRLETPSISASSQDVKPACALARVVFRERAQLAGFYFRVSVYKLVKICLDSRCGTKILILEASR